MAKKIKVEEPVPEKKQAEENKDGIFDPDGELVVDVYETDSSFVVLAAIAGVLIKDMDISIEKDMMVIKGNRCDPHNHSGKKYFYQECYWGPFSRKIVLPENIDIEEADAQMEKGLLTIKIPKTDGNGKGKIGVTVS
ncbi:MAG: Protein containing Heat shock protein Hsp20 protein [Parcubacteria group bacterium GW2011_GWA2_37_10]|nr:MAG: Protein containing Heat shock protein Hsp20 protein [Parcubacteria group bacterium GW2011_GWA2_37_10]